MCIDVSPLLLLSDMSLADMNSGHCLMRGNYGESHLGNRHGKQGGAS